MARGRLEVVRWLRLSKHEFRLVQLAADDAGVSTAAMLRLLVIASLGDAMRSIVDTQRVAG